ncbi:Mur ligase family protein [Rathayibacter sp. Leaf248]|uniref:Mur ligase family protein n=1 Tax=Rathayibacter sp. Leaf248 TaxID=2876555 RepID=UPI001E2C91C3|nr:UDP-N-acetylmuramoyl-L-alanyl-D-glutamate--2,6-diaminopimelate ligase [Rathayibacter sp. Leaf248]
MPDFAFLRPRSTAGAVLSQLAATGARLEGPDVRVTSATVSDREVEPGGLFAALPGRGAHGADFVERARAAGAVAVLTDEEGAARVAGLPVLVAPDPRRVLGRIAARVYGTDSARPPLFGVTGTNGKTTTVHLLTAVLEQLGRRVGHSSTATRRSGSVEIASRLTSPEAPELHALLARMVEDGVDAAALEVSAQALTRHRVDGLHFDVAGFTNLSHDHLDDYGGMDEYLRAKARLLHPSLSRRAVVLLDSPAGERMRDLAEVPVVTVASLGGTGADWRVEVLESTTTRTAFRLSGPGGSLTTSVPLVGRHMAADAGLALVMLLSAGHPLPALAEAVRDGIHARVPGRSLLVSGERGPRVYLDFSHTPDSIEKTVAALREVTPGRVIVVLGADGDRDPSKRAPMGRAAAEGADVVVVTDHHPRSEDPARIRRALLEGARLGGDVREIAEPAEAIRSALGSATASDSVLWVGPGDTDYRLVRGVEVPYSPRRDAREALVELGWG